MRKFLQKKQLILIIGVFFLLVFSAVVRYYPVIHRGFPSNVTAINLVLARNLSLTGDYKITDKKEIILSSSLIRERGVIADTDNKLTPVLYSKIFDVFGFNYNLPVYVSIFLYGFITVLLFLLILKLFNWKVAAIFGILDIFTPMILRGVNTIGFYEFALLFFATALFIYLYKERAGWLRLVLSSLFFGLAVLSRSVFLVSFIPFIIYEWWKNRSFKRVIIFVLPFVLLFGGVLLCDHLKGMEHSFFIKNIGYDGHLFRDPYTYLFEKEDFIRSIGGTSNSMLNEYLLKYGHKITLKNRLIMYFDSAKYYLVDLFKLITAGGPLMVLFMGAGVFYLRKRKRYLLILFLFWLVIWYVLLVYLKTNNWDHFLEISFPLLLLLGMGIYWLAEYIWESNIGFSSKCILLVSLFLGLILHFGQADKWMFHDVYSNSKAEIFQNLIQQINQGNVVKNDVIAVGLVAGGADLLLNYYTDYSYIYFNSETIKKLLKEDKLQWAFDQFGVTKIVAYDRNLTDEIIKATNVKNLANYPCD